MGAHSIIPPSAAHIWGAPNGCPGWVLMNQRFPRESGEAARGGTVAHAVGERLLRVHDHSVGRGPAAVPYEVGELVDADGAGVAVTRDMIDAAEMYANFVTRSMHRAGLPTTYGIEQHVTCPNIHELSGGTPDFWMYDANKQELLVVDFKYGRRAVEAVENWQMLNYSSGICNKINPTPKTIRTVIIQPRAYHREGPVREWVFAGSELQGYESTLAVGAGEALGPNPSYRTGEHCRCCPGRFMCDAAIDCGVSLYESVTEGLPRDTDATILGRKLTMVRRALKQLEYLESGISSELETRVKRGDYCEGYRMERKPGKLVWSGAEADIKAIADTYGVNVTKETLITPTQARKAGLPDDALKGVTERPTSTKLIEDDGSYASSIFLNS